MIVATRSPDSPRTSCPMVAVKVKTIRPVKPNEATNQLLCLLQPRESETRLSGITSQSSSSWNNSCPKIVALKAGNTPNIIGSERQWIAQIAEIEIAYLSKKRGSLLRFGMVN